MTNEPEQTPGAASSGPDPQPEGIALPDWSGGLQQPHSGYPARSGVNLVEQAEQAVAEACFRHGQGERVEYACSFTVIGDEQGRMQPMIALFLAIPGLVLEERAHGTTLLPLWSGSEQIDQTVREVLESCRSHRSKEAAQINGQG